MNIEELENLRLSLLVLSLLGIVGKLFPGRGLAPEKTPTD